MDGEGLEERRPGKTLCQESKTRTRPVDKVPKKGVIVMK